MSDIIQRDEFDRKMEQANKRATKQGENIAAIVEMQKQTTKNVDKNSDLLRENVKLQNQTEVKMQALVDLAEDASEVSASAVEASAGNAADLTALEKKVDPVVTDFNTTQDRRKEDRGKRIDLKYYIISGVVVCVIASILGVFGTFLLSKMSELSRTMALIQPPAAAPEEVPHD